MDIFLLAALLKDFTIKFKYIKSVIIISLAILYFFSFDIKPIEEGFNRSKVHYYEDILIPENVEENIYTISNYIREQEDRGLDVAVLNNDAYLYNIPADDVNGILDSLPIGDNNKVIALIKEKDIILTNDFLGYNNIKDIEEYVYNNFVLDGTIGNMNIYKSPKVMGND